MNKKIRNPLSICLLFILSAHFTFAEDKNVTTAKDQAHAEAARMKKDARELSDDAKAELARLERAAKKHFDFRALMVGLDAVDGFKVKSVVRMPLAGSLANIEKVTLHNKTFGKIQFYWRSSPTALTSSATDRPQPTLLLLAGIDANPEYIKLLPNNWPYNVILFDYQLTPVEKLLDDGKIVFEFFRAQMGLLTVMKWLDDNHLVDSRTLVSMNVSFGAYFAPYTLRMLKYFEIEPRATVFAYGGADFISLLRPHIPVEIMQRISEKRMNEAVDFLRPASPETQLKYLRGPFLVVQGMQDQMIPAMSTDILFNNLGSPKTRVQLNTTHITSQNMPAVQQTTQAVMDWLNKLPQ